MADQGQKYFHHHTSIWLVGLLYIKHPGFSKRSKKIDKRDSDDTGHDIKHPRRKQRGIRPERE